MINQKQVHPQTNQRQQPIPIPRRNSLMVIPIKNFAAQQFGEKAVLLCQFCGGQKCKQQDYLTNKIQPNAIEGLHSNWITHSILAMQRPSQRLIQQFKLYEKFKKQNINTILNLQEPGEHGYCGDGLISMVGFSYDPEGFFNQGIKFFNESWEDMTATTFQHMMKIMNIFYVSLVRENGKISVHCHAGRGRTLLVICSWLIYHDRLSAKTTIDLAIQRRQGVLTRASQRQFLSDFQQQLKLRWCTFGPVLGKTFQEFVQLQNTSLLKHQQAACKFRPFVHSNIVGELRSRIQKNPKQSKQIMMAFLNGNGQHFKNKWDNKMEHQLQQLKKKVNENVLFVKQEQQKLIKSIESRILVELLFDFYDGLPFVVLTIHSLESLIQFSAKKQNKMQALLEPQFIHETGIHAIALILDLIHFLKSLIKQNLNLLKQDSEDAKICDCLFIRLSILLSSKRKYCPKIFPPKHNYRECRLMQYEPQKREKYTSTDEIKLANYMRSLTKQMSGNIEQMDRFMGKVRKVDSNLYYFTNKHNSQEGFIKKQQARQIYEKSKL